MLHGYGSSILDGAWLTINLALTSMSMAIALGLIGAAFRLSPLKWLAMLGEGYTTLIRGIPDLVLILLIFYGGQDLVNRIALALGYTRYIDINPFIAGVCTMGFIFGAYLSETFRGAFMAIPKGQAEAGAAYGMSGAPGVLADSGAADDSVRHPGVHQQLVGADQIHRADLGDRLAGHDVQSQERSGRHP